VLGPIDVVVGGRGRPVASARQREVLAMLVVHAGRFVETEALIDALWGDAPPPSAVHTVHGLVWRLRAAIGASAIVAGSRGYNLAGHVDSDSERFERLAVRGRELAALGDADEALCALDAALELWRGRAFGDVAERPFACVAAARLEEDRAAVVEDRGDLLLASGAAARLIGEFEAAALDAPYRDRRQGQLMVALARSGRPVDAMRSYDQFRRRLADEAGMVPTRSLQRLNDEILRQAPGTEWEHEGDDRTERPAALDHLPHGLTTFVGRSDELAVLVEELRIGGSVTLCGPAGVGKTRLALEAARVVAAAGGARDGVWWCDLSAVSADQGHDAVVRAAAATLGASSGAGVPLVDRLVGFLASKDLTLVVDNCEHVAGPVAELAAALLQAAPRVGLLATSREPLAVAGERVIEVRPLADDDAIRLFGDRAAAARAGFTIDDRNAKLVADICRRLDALPLALELAAGRLGSVGLEDLARLLEDRFRVLVSNRRDAPDRHRTIRAAIDSSYEALAEDQQAVFDRLAVFPASFALDAAEAVCAEGPITARDVLGHLSHLVARSLVLADADSGGAVRYRLLETLRSYAWERLGERGPEAASSAQRRHAEHFAMLTAEAAPGMAGPEEARWLTWLAAEMANLRAGVHWAIGHGDLELAARLFIPIHPWAWCGISRTAEIGSWAARLARQPGIEDVVGHEAVRDWTCRGAIAAGEVLASCDWVERFIAGEAEPTAPALAYLAYVTLPADARRANDMFLRAADMARTAGDHLTESALRTWVVNSQPSFVPPSPEGVAHIRSALAAARASGSPTAIAWGLFGVATTLGSVDRELALAAIDELPSVVARCAFPDMTLLSGAEYALAFLRISDGDLAGLDALRNELRARVIDQERTYVTVHLLRVAAALVHLGERPGAAAEIIAGVRAQRLVFTSLAEESAELLRTRMGDASYDAATRRGQGMTLDQLVERASTTIDELLTARA
jgi:predicted ATPase/DNA-binding SARP family transcriptional activator